ncbi:MAG: hypothetical protein H7Z18_08240 [Methylophilaceae bacterium]|nr:hypothetical protein [Methylophilaceae bacterium]
MKKAPSPITAKGPSDNLNFNIIDTLRARFLAGNQVRVIDFHESVRAEVMGAIKTLQDELPIVTGWQTVRQSFLSETRTRARSYHIPEAFLKEVAA